MAHSVYSVMLLLTITLTDEVCRTNVPKYRGTLIVLPRLEHRKLFLTC